MSEIHVRHKPNCMRPPLTARAVPGGVKHSCPGCLGYFVVWDAPLDAPVAASTQPASAYRCREHPGEPVTWKGTGCTRCPTRKANKRKAGQPSDYTEMEYRT